MTDFRPCSAALLNFLQHRIVNLFLPVKRYRMDWHCDLVPIPVFWIMLLRFNLSYLFTGACEGSVACSTCHIILPPEQYDLLPEPEDDENDMLDMAFGLTDTSRLGCQVKLTKELDGITCTLPAATRNMFVDGECRKVLFWFFGFWMRRMKS